jgi:TPR repeat protein
MRLFFFLCAVLCSANLPSLPEDFTPSPHVLERVRREARQGSAPSLYMLGLYQFYGAGSEPVDREAALRSFRASSDLSYGPAALAVGLLLDSAPGGSQGAFPYLLRAGELGEQEGLFRAGLMLYEGRAQAQAQGGQARGGRGQDMAEALRLLQRSSQAGYAPAFDALGLMHEYGAHSNNVQDMDMAASMYRKGCHWVRASAAAAAAPSQPGSSGIASAAAAAAAASAAALQGSAGDRADPEACYHLGLLQAYGRGMPQDYRGAVATLQRASALSPGGVHAPSALLLARLHANGQGVPVDYHAALAHLASARDSGDDRVAEEAQHLYQALDAQVTQAEVGMAEVLAELQAGLREGRDS